MPPAKRRTRRSFGAVRKLPSGRYQASYLDPHGNRVNAPETFTAKIDADAWLSVQRAALETGTWKPRDNALLFGEFAESWLTTHQIRERSRYTYRNTYEHSVAPTFRATPIGRITAPMVRRWYATLPQDRPAARANAYRVLAQILRAAVDDGIIPESPARIRGASTYSVKREGRALTVDELLTFAEHVPRDRRLLVLLGGFCALRPGEALALRRRSVDTKDHVLHIRETASNGGKTVKAVGPVKTARSVRSVHYPETLHDLIQKQLTDYAAPGATGHLFPSPVAKDQPLSYSSFAATFRRAARAAGLEDLRPHDLRHSGLTLAAATGATTRELMDRAGHTSPATAMGYQHAVRERDKRIADALGAAISAAGKDDDRGDDDE